MSERELLERWKTEDLSKPAADLVATRTSLNVGVDVFEFLKMQGIDPKRLKDQAEVDPKAFDNVAGETLEVVDRMDADGVPAFDGVSAGQLGLRDVEQLSQTLGEAQRFKVRVDGDSMAPEYPRGSWVYFSRPRAMAEGIVDGKDYLVVTSDGGSTFKQVVRSTRDPEQYVVLVPRNPDRKKYPEQLVHRREVALVARAVGKFVPIG
jgi:phage repressor protein C with HTH and peptisase S24 domain